MSSAIITVENLGKKYQLLHQRNGRGNTPLREALTLRATSLFRGLTRSNGGPGARQTGSAPTREEFWALRDVSFEVKEGEVLGIIGRNGAGKSTLLKILSRITEPSQGRVCLRGRVASLLEVGTGFHPDLTGRENVFLNGAILGMKRVEIKRKFDEIVAFAGVERFLDTPVKRYSSGMYVRLAFAVAAHLEPEILVVDEVLAVGDMEFQKKCLGKMENVAAEEGRTVIFVSHNIQAVRQLCNRVAVFEKGQLAFCGDVSAGVKQYAGGEVGGLGATIDLSDYPRNMQSDGVRLLRVEFTDPEGRPALQVQRSASLKVTLHFTVERLIEDLDLPMAIVHVEGQRVFSEVYSDRFGTISLSPGLYECQFSIPLEFLKIESYFLVVGAIQKGILLDFVEGLPLPEIIDSGVDSFLESRRWGLVRIPLEWVPVRQISQNVVTISRIDSRST